jgi:16S rRNA processing protein RimM
MTEPAGLTCVGAIAGGFGVKGEVRLKSFCADPAAIASYAPLVTEDGRSFGVRILRPIPGAFAARLTGVLTREEAEALKGTRLYAPRDRLPPLDEDEFYHADLIGLAAVDPGGAPLGTVRAVLDHGAGDILESAGPGGRELLVPFTRAAVPTVDLAGGRIVVDPPAESGDEPGPPRA